MKTKFGRPNKGCCAHAVVLTAVLWCLRAPACGGGLWWKRPTAPLALVLPLPLYQLAGFYGLGAIFLCLLAVAAVRWAHRRRRRALRQRDHEVFQLVAARTKSLREEVAKREQAQRALQESQEFILRQERLAAAGQLTAGLAHEFNNVMTIVQGHACLLMDNPHLDQEGVKSVAYINDGVERMAKLIQQMLAVSRQRVMQRKALDLRETLGHTSATLSRILGERVALSFDIPTRLPPILADPAMVQQIMVNLVVNAREAMGSGGQLTIRASKASFAVADIAPKSGRRAGEFVRLSVTDTGSGMDPTIINHLFEPFFTTKDVGKGSGLGLATVYGMVSQLEGWIQVESQVGCGTTFDLYFPVSQVAPAEPAAADLPAVRGGKETVLMVEDELMLRELARDILTAQGYQVLEAANGLEALSLWDRGRDKVDLLLTDIAMPHGISGRDLAEQLRRDNPRLPVIFSSGYSRDGIQRREDANQGLSFLAEPYKPAELAQAVRQALDADRKGEGLAAAATS